MHLCFITYLISWLLMVFFLFLWYDFIIVLLSSILHALMMVRFPLMCMCILYMTGQHILQKLAHSWNEKSNHYEQATRRPCIHNIKYEKPNAQGDRQVHVVQRHTRHSGKKANKLEMAVWPNVASPSKGQVYISTAWGLTSSYLRHGMGVIMALHIKGGMLGSLLHIGRSKHMWNREISRQAHSICKMPTYERDVQARWHTTH